MAVDMRPLTREERFKSGVRAGRPKTPLEIRQLIRNVSIANPLWGAPRIHGELLKLGIDVGQTTVAKYMASRSLAGSIGTTEYLIERALDEACSRQFRPASGRAWSLRERMVEAAKSHWRRRDTTAAPVFHGVKGCTGCSYARR